MHCTNCNTSMTKRRLRQYQYDWSGLTSVRLHGGVEEFNCPACGSKATSFLAMGKLHRALALAVVSKRSRLSSDEVRFLRDYLGMTNQEFAKAMGVTPYHTSRWVNGSPISALADRLLRLFVTGGAGQAAADHHATKEVIATLLQGTCLGRARLEAHHVGANWKVSVIETSH